MHDRSVLLLAREPIQSQLQGLLHAQDWLSCVPPNPENVEELVVLARDVCKTGILHFDRTYADDIERIEAITNSTTGVEWIALIPPELLSHRAARRLIKSRFHDFHTLPLDPERLLMGLGHAEGLSRLDDGLPSPRFFSGMVGDSLPMQRLYREIAKAGSTGASVMICGESGTGKELVARAIHDQSGRRERPFVAVNCAALPANLIQSELFGYEKGAFTGAVASKAGRFEAANGGTLFLDEIGDLPHELQVNLLRVLQNRVVERLGSHRQIELDFKIVCATHVNLEDAVEQGRLREDLYYRLNVLRLNVPPLRERGDDIELLAQHYLERSLREKHSRSGGFTNAAVGAMAQHAWPGNVRELVNMVRRAVIMSENRLLTPDDLGLEKRVPVADTLTIAEARVRAEDHAIRNALRRTRNNMTDAARQLGISRATLYRMLERCNREQALGDAA